MSASTQVDWLDIPADVLAHAREQRRQGTQGLLTDTPRSRRADPETSHRAADAVRKSGQLRESQQLVKAAVAHWPGCTAVELSRRMDGTVCRDIPRPDYWWRLEVSRRLPELEPLHVKRGEARRCTVNGNPQTTWWPA